MLSMEENNFSFSTYNSLNRPAMQFGIPLMLLLGLAFFTLIFVCIGYIILRGFGILVILLLSGIVFIALREVCKNDPNALNSIFCKLKSYYLILTKGKKGVIAFSNVFDNRDIKNEIKKYRK